MANPEKLKSEAKELKKAAKYLEVTAEKQEEGVGVNDAESAAKETISYEPNEVLKALAQPPKPGSKSKVKPSQIRSIVVGFALAALAMVVWPIFGTSVALAIAIVGAAFIALGSLIQI